MVDVGRDDGSAPGHFVAYELGGNFLLQVGAKGIALKPFFAFIVLDPLFPFLVFTNGDELHLGSDDSLFGVMHLRDILSRLSA